MAVYRVPINLVWPGPGSPGVNVFHVRTSDPIDDGAELQAAVDALREFYDTLNGEGVSSESVYPVGFTANIGSVIDVQTQVTKSPTFATITGAAPAGNAPQVLQVCISWRTTISARRGRGRTFVGPLATQVMDVDGTPKAQHMAQVREAADELIAASVLPDGWAVGIWGLQNAAPDGTPPDGYDDLPHVLRDITGQLVQDKFATLRSRRD